MNTLLEKIWEAHGGSRWDEVSTISANRRFGGVFWSLKQVAGVAESGRFTVDLRTEHTQLFEFGDPGVHTDFSPNAVSLVDSEGQVIETLDDPRSSFAGHELTTPWTRLQLAYFTGYAMWTYNTEPKSFTFPGVLTEDIGPWTEPDGQVWDRLRITYPASIATHSTVQTVYADSDGILRRRYYDVDIAGGSPSVEYMTEQTTVSGLVLPLKREIFVRDENGHAVRDPLIVSIEIDGVEVGG